MAIAASRTGGVRGNRAVVAFSPTVVLRKVDTGDHTAICWNGATWRIRFNESLASLIEAALATARIVDGDLVVTPELAIEGAVEIALVSTDAAGLSTTVRFEVRVEFHWPRDPAGGWRRKSPFMS